MSGKPISEWHPGRATYLAWTALQVPLLAIGIAIYVMPASGWQLPTSGTFGLIDIALLCALAVGLGAVHEGIHGLVARAFGARPEYGILRYGGMIMGFYATTPGHLFSRAAYAAVALAPLAVLAPLGVPMCLSPLGAYLALPFAIHLGGCIGDVSIAWHILRAPRGALCEDLRDGARFWEPVR